MLVKNVIVGDLDRKYDHPLAEIVNIASQCDSHITLEYENYHINAKSIMGMMSLGLAKGGELTVITDGSDESAAVEHIERFLNGEAV